MHSWRRKKVSQQFARKLLTHMLYPRFGRALFSAAEPSAMGSDDLAIAGNGVAIRSIVPEMTPVG